MSTDIWIAVGIVFVIVWIAIIWEAWNTPITPDNYNEDGINPDYESINGSKNEKQYKKGLYNGDTDKWYPDNKI